MNYKELNNDHKRKMQEICNHQEHFEWEDSNLIDYLKGNLPNLRNTSYDLEVAKLFKTLSQKYREYTFFDSNPKVFISEISSIIDTIRDYDQYWYGVSIYDIENTMNLHKGCLISGEGGIGKSYFIKCLEEELEKLRKNHLCLYGKFCPSIKDIDFKHIETIARTEEFVFIFDAINEIDKESQLELINELKKIKDTKGLRIIITYRSHTMDDHMVEEYQTVAKYSCEFSGVSFESAMEWIHRFPINDVNEYIDVLYSNNPLVLRKLPDILKNQKSRLNNVCRFTYIYEQIIKESLGKITWEKTKIVAKLLYENNKKTFSIKEIVDVIDEPIKYVSEMEQIGLINKYDTENFSFVIESLADFLIIRYMLKEITEKNIDEYCKSIKQKLEKFYSLSKETVIIMLFDKFKHNYHTIKDVLIKTDLISSFRYSILTKIHFQKKHIPSFLEHFTPKNTNNLLIEFGGYLNSPFNCTNFLSEYYLKDIQKQTKELSKCLSGNYFLTNLKRRLKNILYFICKCECTEERSLENFYTAIWCTASCDLDIRNLAIKILYETILKNETLIDKAVELYEKIEDDYIKDSIIFVLSSFDNNSKIKSLFEALLNNYNFTLSKSIKRMSEYIKKPNSYIISNKKNLYIANSKEISDNFKKFIHRIDLMEKNLVPFKVWGAGGFELNRQFLLTPKDSISELNIKLSNDFSCVKEGFCRGNMCFEDEILKFYDFSSMKKHLENVAVLASFESVFLQVLSRYGLPLEYDKCIRIDNTNFAKSILRKCTCISVDVFFGSLMCNYFLDDFSTYNNIRDSIGYEIYDPLEFGEELKIRSPLPIFNPKTEKMCNKVLSKIEQPIVKDESWWKDLSITKKNIIKMLQTIKYDGHEWILLSSRISIKESNEDYEWKDNYNLFVCSSTKETIFDDGKARKLTIEIDDYLGDLINYKNCKCKPWLCKTIPSIDYNAGLFDDVVLVVPPAEIISTFKLSLNVDEMCWYNDNGEKIICCNNNKTSYYSDPIMGTVFIRKDAYEELLKHKKIKFFAFAERYIKDKGFCTDTSFHFEIVDGKITKEYPNYKVNYSNKKIDIPNECLNCKYSFYHAEDFVEAKDLLFNIIEDFGY